MRKLLLLSSTTLAFIVAAPVWAAQVSGSGMTGENAAMADSGFAVAQNADSSNAQDDELPSTTESQPGVVTDEDADTGEQETIVPPGSTSGGGDNTGGAANSDTAGTGSDNDSGAGGNNTGGTSGGTGSGSSDSSGGSSGSGGD